MKKIFGSLKKIIALLMLVGGTWLLWWNEGISAATGSAIGEARAVAAALPAVTTADLSYNGKMVHATGFADTKEIITDPLTGASAAAISLQRKVQYFQITESRSSRTIGRGGENQREEVTYTYEEKWTDRPINSSYFYFRQYDRNVILMEIPNETFYAGDVTFGAYLLSPAIAASIPGSAPVGIEMEPETLAKLEAQITPPSTLAAGRSYVHIRGNEAYLGRSPSSPRIGDVRVTYTAVQPSNISILAQISGNTFEPFKASNGSEFSRVSTGTIGMGEMFGDAESQNTANMWVRRVMGTLLAAFGLKMLMTAKLSAKKAFLFGLVWSVLVIVAGLAAASL